ncbi:MAG: nicotinamide mononucleotide transporter [Saprospiraceae bacterium]|nr:nicotinamide mononucleotide transporter [Saprospiraceae bacterium]
MAVYYAAKENILTWPIGLINIITAFFIYYHVRLYSDMFLQIYFICISIYMDGLYGIWNIEMQSL